MNSKKRVLIVTQEAALNHIGGAITMYYSFSCLISKHFNCRGVCYSTNISIKENQGLLNLFYVNKKNSYSESLNCFIDDYKPDLIVFFFSYLLSSADFSNRSDIKRIPKILMFHSRPDFYFAFGDGAEESLKLQYDENTYSQVLFPEYYDLLPQFIKSNKVFSVSNFIDLPKYQVDLSITKKKIVFLSRIDCLKGLEFLIDSAEFFLKNNDWSLDIYGEPSDIKYLNLLEERVNKKKLQDRVKFCGCVNNSFETLLKYDIYVTASVIEGQSVALMEAMSVGLPCIGLKSCSGVNLQIVNGVTGILSENSPEKLSQCVSRLIFNKDERIYLGKNAREYSKKFSKEVIETKWLNAISSILNRGELIENTIEGTCNSDYSKQIIDAESLVCVCSKYKKTIYPVKYFVLIFLNKVPRLKSFIKYCLIKFRTLWA